MIQVGGGQLWLSAFDTLWRENQTPSEGSIHNFPFSFSLALLQVIPLWSLYSVVDLCSH